MITWGYGHQSSHSRLQHTPQELAPFQGQFVAWSEDGLHILAHGKDLPELFRELDRKGIVAYVIDSIPPQDEDFLGGGTL